MTRQSISLTTPNDAWLNMQVGRDKEYTSKSELVNDLIRKAREDQERIELIRRKLIDAEHGGFVIPERTKMLAEFKHMLRDNE